MTWLKRLRAALKSYLQLGSALAIAVGMVVLLWIGQWVIYGRSDRTEVRRWARGGGLEETTQFADMINHPQNRGKWQTGINSRETRPTTIRRNERAPDEDSLNLDYSVPRVSVYSVPNIRPPHALPTLRELGDRAQVRAIDAIERDAQSQPAQPQARAWDSLQKALSDEGEPGERDPFLFERVLVATVAKGTQWPPGDRMVWTRTFVRPINFKFAAYTIAATESETVKVSSVEATNVRKVSADIALTIPGVEGSKVGLKPSNEDTVKTTSEISTQYERLGIDITSTFLRIMRESAAGGDVNGNTRIALSMTTDPDEILKGMPYKDNDHLTSPDIKLVVTGLHVDEAGKSPTMEVLPLVPLPHCSLWATIWTLYEQRHIQDNQRIYDESQQTVGFIHDVDEPRNVEIVGADDVSPFVWSIQIVPRGQPPRNDWADNRRALNASFEGTGAWRQLVFSDYGRAAKLAHWVRTQTGNGRLSDYYFNYDPSEGLAVIKQTRDDCREDGNNVRPTREGKVPPKSDANDHH